MKPTKSEAIKRFLEHSTLPALAKDYNISMECQVNVGQDGGESISGDYKGRKWVGWTDGFTTWKAFRIPYRANTDPFYEDYEIKFDLARHAEGIGMTGWDWEAKRSRWVAYDFDAIVGHSKNHTVKLTNEELEDVKKRASEIPWVTIRKSTSGRGLHLYVYIDVDMDVNNHNEHAAIARSILGHMSALTGFDFSSKVDICGGNMWIWHRKMAGTDGLTIIKRGTVLKKIPPNWKDHVKVVSGQNRRTHLQKVPVDKIDIFEQISGQYPKIPLDENHQRLINYLRDEDAYWWWDQDHHMLVCHTVDLKSAHEGLQFKGFYETSSSHSSTHNCFAYPLRRGAWAIRRFTPGVREHDSWDQDGSGWTRCFYNREPDLRAAARAFGGVEDPKGGFVFRETDVASRAAELLGVHMEYDPQLGSRETKLKEHKDGRLVVEIKKESMDQPSEMPGWLSRGGTKPWSRIYSVQSADPIETEIGSYDDLVRHIVTEENDAGWTIRADNSWRQEPWNHVRIALGSMGYKNTDITMILGSAIFKAWKLVNKPFQPEYTGDREWNRDAAQLRYKPLEETEGLIFDHWSMILNHIGLGLDEAVKQHSWCKVNGIKTGAEYLKCWIASVFQEPAQPLPYLFLYSRNQNTGKSIFHEALNLLLTKGYRRADAALTSQSNFNGELADAIICVVEEVSMDRNKNALNRIKDWVTATEISIHAKGKTPYQITNTTHWVQCANNHKACPIFPGDTRITMVQVPDLDVTQSIPKRVMLEKLDKEAQHFLTEVLNMEIPQSNDRLNIPVVDTYEKSLVVESNRSMVDVFLEQKCTYAPGYKIKYADLYNAFCSWIGPQQAVEWGKKKFGAEIPQSTFPKGRADGSSYFVGNIVWSRDDEHITPQEPLKLSGDKLV